MYVEPEIAPVVDAIEAITGKDTMCGLPLPEKKGDPNAWNLTAGERIGRVIDAISWGAASKGTDFIGFMKGLLGENQVHHWIMQMFEKTDFINYAESMGIDVMKMDYNQLPLAGHEGGHTNEYKNFVRGLLETAMREMQKEGGWDKERTEKEIKAIIDTILDKVDKDEVKIYENPDKNKQIVSTLDKLEKISELAEADTSGRDAGGKSEGGGDKIICAELYRQGLMAEDIYRADEEFGRYLKDNRPEVLAGYQLWARPVVELMRKSKAFTYLVNYFAEPWTYEMAYRTGKRENGDAFGALLMDIGVPICEFLGKAIQEKVNWELIILTHVLVALLFSFIFSVHKNNKRFKGWR